MAEEETKAVSLDERLKSAIAAAESIETALYSDNDYEEFQKAEIDRIEEGFKALNRKLAVTPDRNNRFGYSAAGYLSKGIMSKHMAAMKHGLYSIYPIPCKQGACPYAQSCIAQQNCMAPPLGEPCVIETVKIEMLITNYALEFDIESASTTDRTLIQELVQLDLIIDRAQNLLAQEADPLQQINSGSTQQGEIYTQPVVSRYLDVYERMSKRRLALYEQLLATRKAKKDVKAEAMDEADIIMKMAHGNDFFEVEQRPDEFK